MNKTIKKSVFYYLAAVLFSWIFWISAMIISVKNQITIPYNEGFYSILTNGYDSIMQMNAYIIFSLAVYGPLAGVLICKILFRADKNSNPSQIIIDKQVSNVKWMIFIFLYPIVLFSLGALISVMTTGFKAGLKFSSLPFWFLPILFLYQCLTSGTEEFGWRGFLQPLLQDRYSAEKACYLIGILWSVWHYPFIIYTNYKGGIFLTILSLVGFTMLTIPQALVMGWLYNSTKNIYLSVIFHAWSNTVSFYIFAAAPNPQITPIVIAVATWFIANYLVKKYGKEKLRV